MKKKALILLSGGLESSALIPYLIDKGGYDSLEALNVFYGQTNSKEQESAEKIADYYNVPIDFIDLSKVFEFSSCAMISKNKKDVFAELNTSAQAKSLDYGVSEKTFIPYRNGVFVSVATSIAYSKKCSDVFCGIHGLNDAQEMAYPDCSKKFVETQILAVSLGTGGYLNLVLPFKSIQKYEVLNLGLKLNLPYELTWSCYTNNKKPCRKCFACIERAKAYKLNNAVDPLLEEKV